MEASGRLVRSVRLLVTASTVVALAVGAHVTAGGAPPSVPLLAGTTGLVAAATAVLARRRLHAATLLPLLGGAQVALHHLFCLAPAGASPGRGMAGTTSPSMLAAHVVAAAVTAAALLSADRAALRCTAWLARVAPLLAAVLPPVPTGPDGPQRVRPDGVVAPARPRDVLLRCEPRRGPPAARPVAACVH